MELVLTSILTISTVLLAIYTFKLVSESRKARKAGAHPYISFSLGHSETKASFLYLLMENKGNGPARNMKIEVIEELSNPGTMKFSEMGVIKHGMKECPPGFNEKIFLTDLSQHYEDKIKECIKLAVTYNTIFEENESQTFNLPLQETAGFSILNPPDTHVGRIAMELKEIKELLKKQSK